MTRETEAESEGPADSGASGATALASLSYEQARAELVEVVRRLEAGGVPLEESLALWERGEELSRICREWLEGARARLDEVLAAEEDEENEDAEDPGDAEDAEELEEDEDDDPPPGTRRR
ncbi:exodeoxyribonuclease VII small subunit [Streptomyces sp. AJS327]|uniref:exodeoxyribonuclease VII small subunit n=1 Tax=Streptomyces sp. AJS327 TaxID=2545265 RepID=UPI0015E05BD8|nr:exodeoxyribonuclease VII small subunit [Streptomyces sp. AJS327]MBA0051348.1 exodeoxyribonuclease VII small subunit [Streptomyces sp. AJS327]